MRRKAALKRLRESDGDLYRAEVKRAILASLTRKQMEVVDTIRGGHRYIALGCGRRAGKTTLLSKLIILTLLDCGHNEAAFYVAWSLQIGVGLIWKELERLCEAYGLDEYWRLRENDGQIDTPEGASFFVMGLNKTKQSNRGRGFKGKFFCIDESQDVEHLLAKTLTAIAPGLTDCRGIFIAAGTGPYVTQGTWHEWTSGEKGFRAFNWNILDNEKFPQDPHETLREEMTRNGWTESHPDFIREWLGKAANDIRVLVCEFLAERNTLTEMPPEYTLEWRHVIGMDYGWDDAITWVVVAANPYGPERIVVHAEAHSHIDNDVASEITSRLVKQYQTSYVVCDPAGGGKGFYETFNSRYGHKLGCQITAAYKIGKVDCVKNMNTDLRTGRLQLLIPAANGLAEELRVLQWKDKSRGEVLTSDKVRDDLFDAARYAYAEIGPWREKEAPSPEQVERIRAEQQLRDRMRDDPELREREQRNRAARKKADAPWWGGR